MYFSHFKLGYHDSELKAALCGQLRNDWQLSWTESLSIYRHSFFVFLPLGETVALLLRDVHGPKRPSSLEVPLAVLCCVQSPSVRPLRHFTSSCLLRPARAPPAPRVPIDSPRHAPLAAKEEATICWCASGRRWHFKGMPARSEPAPHWPPAPSLKGGLAGHAHRHCGARTTSGAGFKQDRFKAHYVHRIPGCQLTPSTLIPPGIDEHHNSGNMFAADLWCKKSSTFPTILGNAASHYSPAFSF